MSKQAAKASPRPGDIWEKQGEKSRYVSTVKGRRLVYHHAGVSTYFDVALSEWNRWAKKARRVFPQNIHCHVCGAERHIVRDSKGAMLACWNGCSKLESAGSDIVNQYPERVIEAKPVHKMLAEIKEAMALFTAEAAHA